MALALAACWNCGSGEPVGLLELDQERVRCFTATDRVTDVSPDPDGGAVWVATDGGLLRFVLEDSEAFEGPIQKLTRRDGLTAHGIRELARSHEGALWVATDRGVTRLAEGRIARFTTRDGLPDERSLAVTVDLEGRVLVGTGRGAAVLDGDRFEPLHDTHEFGRRATWEIHAAADGSIWFAKENALTRQLPDGGCQVWQRDPLLTGPRARLIDNTVRAVVTDGKGRPWIGTPRGIGRLDEAGWTHLARRERLAGEADLRADGVVTLAVDRRQRIWVGHGDRPVAGAGHGAAVFGDPGWRYFTAADGLPDDHVLRVRVDEAGDPWFATAGGAARLSGGRFLAVETPGELPANHVVRIRSVADGQVVVTTAGGPVRFSGGEPGPFGFDDPEGPVDRPAPAVSRSDGRLVLEDGTVAPLPAELDVEPRAAVRTADGVLWLGTARHGLLRHDAGGWVEARLHGLRFPPQITALHLDGRGALWVGTATEGLLVLERGAVPADR